MGLVGALWVDASNVAGSIATALGLIGGVAIAILYGRKATAQVAAEAHLVDGEILLSARPSVCAVGLFRLRLSDKDGAALRVTEIILTEEAVRDGRHWDADAIFGDSFVEGGETLTTTVLFPLGVLPFEVAGWRVSFGVTVKRWPSGGGWSWADQVFVARPAGRMGVGKEATHAEDIETIHHATDDEERSVAANDEGEGSGS